MRRRRGRRGNCTVLQYSSEYDSLLTPGFGCDEEATTQLSGGHCHREETRNCCVIFFSF